MPKQVRPLTPISVRNRKPGASRQEVPDPGCKGLYLVVQPTGVKSWAIRYRFAGKPQKLTLGPVYLGDDEPEEPAIDQALTLAGARKLAGEAALNVAKGVDPESSRNERNRRPDSEPRMQSWLIGTPLRRSLGCT
jgi:Arm domain-containing DNA-binding protein